MHSKKATAPRAVSKEGENRFSFNGKQLSGYVQKMNEGNFVLLGNNDRLEEWIRKNKISLKKEEGLLAFLEEWNASGKQ